MMSENKKYFCINCFEDKNIRNIIKSNGRLVKNQIYKCESCEFETCNEYEVQECIQEYIDTCIKNIQESVTEEDYENNEESYIFME